MTAVSITPGPPYQKVYAVSIDDNNDVINSASLNRDTGTFTVTGGTGSVALTDLNYNVQFVGVKGPSGTTTFTATFKDTDVNMRLTSIQSRSSADEGTATGKQLGIPFYNVTLTITAGSEDGTYTYLIMG